MGRHAGVVGRREMVSLALYWVQSPPLSSRDALGYEPRDLEVRSMVVLPPFGSAEVSLSKTAP